MLIRIQIAVVFAIAVTATSAAHAQSSASHHSTSQVPRYTPHSPTTSPYLGLLNHSGSAATNYYTLVRPLQEQQTVNETQSKTTSSEEKQIGKIQQEQEGFDQPTVNPTGTAGWFQNQTKKASYQTASHFYGQWQPPKARRNTSSAR